MSDEPKKEKVPLTDDQRLRLQYMTGKALRLFGESVHRKGGLEAMERLVNFMESCVPKRHERKSGQ